MKKFFICGIMTVFSALGLMAQSPVDSAKIYFRIGHRQFDPTLGDNRAAMQRFVERVKKADDADDVHHIVVRTYASPDGSTTANERLTRNRCDEITRHIVSATGVDAGVIKAYPEGVAWDELRRLVAVTPGVPDREAVMEILDKTPVWVYDEQGKVTDSRKNRLMMLNGGKPYLWLYDNIFPQLRNAVAVSLFLKSDVKAARDAAPNAARAAADAANAAAEAAQAAAEALAAQEAKVEGSDNSDRSDASEVTENSEPVHRFALKTNILYYAILAPNLEIEWRINQDWSVALEGDVAWWKNDPKHKYYQVAVITPEVRRWLHPRAPWHGMYVGLFAGGSWYDLENGKKGYHGEAGLGGVSFGYMWPIARNWSMEAGLGVGYAYTRYREYIPYDGHYLYQRTKTTQYVGPLKLKLSIAWRFNDINKKTVPAL